MSFSTFGLADCLLRSTTKYAGPTPVQTRVVPSVLDGRDVIAIAPTGSGKTTAFVLPLLQNWFAGGRERSRSRRVSALVLVPTRELAAQVREVFQELSRDLPERIKVVSAVGGVSINPQMMALRGGADFIVATPGRLLELVQKNALTLSSVSTLVLDEADRMLDLGFADELGRVLAHLPAGRQNLLFSATFPAGVEEVARGLLKNPERVEIGPDPSVAPAIRQRAIRVDKAKRTPLLRHLLATEGWERVLVFVATQYSADHVADKLGRNGIRALSFHGDLSQGARKNTLDCFKEGSVQVVVATDLAARGLDIAHLPAVLNYDLPRSAEDYTHRIGRTGRAGAVGTAVSFITAESHAHFALIEKRQRAALPREVIEGFEPTEEPPLPPATGGGVKGRRKSKKDKLREAAARKRT